jgi:hypothetical protein
MQKLPVFSTFFYILRLAVGNFGMALRMCWPWLLIVIPVYVAFSVWLSDHPFPSVFSDGSEFAALFLWIIGISLLVGVALSSFAVTWHRHVILGETVTGLRALNVGAKTWRYLLNVIGITFIVAFCMGIPVMFIIAPLSQALFNGSYFVWGVVISLWVVAYLLASAFSTRMLIKVVGIAVGDPNASISDALESSSDNMSRIIGLNVLLLLIFWPIEKLLEIGTSSQFAMSSTAVSSAFFGLDIVLKAFEVFVGIVTLTSLYVFFVKGIDLET